MLDETNYKIDENNSLLILDDDQPFLKRLSVAMEKRGFNVFPAISMADFSKIIESNCPNYAIIDLRLGDGTGLDARGLSSEVGKILEVSTPHFNDRVRVEKEFGLDPKKFNGLPSTEENEIITK